MGLDLAHRLVGLAAVLLEVLLVRGDGVAVVVGLLEHLGRSIDRLGLLGGGLGLLGDFVVELGRLVVVLQAVLQARGVSQRGQAILAVAVVVLGREHEVLVDGLLELEEARVVEAGAQQRVVGELAALVALGELGRAAGLVGGVDALIGLRSALEPTDVLVRDRGVVERVVGVGVVGRLVDERDVAIGGGLELPRFEQDGGLLEDHRVADRAQLAGELGLGLTSAADVALDAVDDLGGELALHRVAVDDRVAGVDGHVLVAVAIDDPLKAGPARRRSDCVAG